MGQALVQLWAAVDADRGSACCGDGHDQFDAFVFGARGVHQLDSSKRLLILALLGVLYWGDGLAYISV